MPTYWSLEFLFVFNLKACALNTIFKSYLFFFLNFRGVCVCVF